MKVLFVTSEKGLRGGERQLLILARELPALDVTVGLAAPAGARVAAEGRFAYQHRASMVIFLSAGMIEKVRDELLTGYPEETPVVVIEKVSWPGEKIVRGTLKDIADKVKNAGINKTALIYVGEALRASEEKLGKESKLYHKDFRHGYRK